MNCLEKNIYSLFKNLRHSYNVFFLLQKNVNKWSKAVSIAEDDVQQITDLNELAKLSGGNHRVKSQPFKKDYYFRLKRRHTLEFL